MNDVGALAPLSSALWLGVVMLGLFLQRARRTRRDALMALGLTPNSPPYVTPLLAVLLMTIGLTRPYWGFKDSAIQGVGADIVAVVDVSRSMLARDASPNRMAVAKRKIADLIEGLAQTGRGDRIGIVLFAGEAYFFLPLTADYGVARSFAGAISTELIPAGGSTLGDALTLVAKTFERTGTQTPRILLLSDGEERSLSPAGVSAQLKKQGIAVFAIGIGSVEGHPIDIGGGELLKDTNGAIVVSRLHEEVLQNIAQATNGTYTRATLADEDIRRFMEFGGARVSTGKTTIRSYNEYGALFAALALALIAAPMFGRLRTRGIAAIFVLSVSLVTRAAADEPPQRRSTPFEGARSYAEGRYSDAAQAFAEGIVAAPERWELHQALGAAQYKKGDFAGAREAFDQALRRATNGRERFESLYARGNAGVMAGRFKEAITDYAEALRIKPNDESTLHNKRLAEELLQESQSKQEPPPSSEQQQQQQQQQQGQKSEPGESPDQDQEAEADEAPSHQGAPEGSDSEETPPEGNTPQPKGDKPQTTDSASKELPADMPSEDEATPSPDDGAAAEPPPSSETSKKQAGPERAATGSEAAAAESDKDVPRPMDHQLSQDDAKSWLQSLDEAPVLLQQRPRKRHSRGEQIW